MIQSFPMALMGKGFLKLKKVTALLDCSNEEVSDLVNRGELTAIKVGRTLRSLRISRESLEDFMERNRVQDNERK